VVESASEIGLTGGLVRRSIAKTGRKMGRFWPCWHGSHTDSLHSRWKIFSPYREQARYAYNGAVFEVKKETPDGLSVLFYTRDI